MIWTDNSAELHEGSSIDPLFAHAIPRTSAGHSGTLELENPKTKSVPLKLLEPLALFWQCPLRGDSAPKRLTFILGPSIEAKGR